MVSNKELQDVVTQVNDSYTLLLNRITELEAKTARSESCELELQIWS